jgi:hypothetical protein
MARFSALIKSLAQSRCMHWRANLLLVATSAITTAVGFRVLIGVYVGIVPNDSWASAMLTNAWLMPDRIFYSTVAIAALGGATSMLHEIKQAPERFSLLNGIGHMFAAQFAGLLAYLLGIEYTLPPALALVACGIAGWGGNRTIQLINDRIINRVFPNQP